MKNLINQKSSFWSNFETAKQAAKCCSDISQIVPDIFRKEK